MVVAECIEAPRRIVRRTVAAGTAIPKGTLMKFSGSPNTAAATAGASDLFAGITIEEKSEGDTDILEVGCAIDGVWDIESEAGGAALGNLVEVGGANTVKDATDGDLEAGSLVGKVEETDAGSDVVRVRLLGY